MAPLKRRLFKLALLLVVGAIINIAVALVCVIIFEGRPTTSPSRAWFYSNAEDRLWHVYAYDNFGISVVLALRSQFLPDIHERIVAKLTNGEVIEERSLATPGAMPRWSLFHEGVPSNICIASQELAYGRPFRSMSRRIETYSTGPERRFQSIEIKHRTLPFGVIWPGFAINTIFYAAVVWLLFFAPFKLRRWRRIKRGLCPACAYPVGTNPRCTECGKPVNNIDKVKG